VSDQTDQLSVPEGSTYDLMFPVIPVVDDPSPPDVSGLDLVDDLADFAEDERPLDLEGDADSSDIDAGEDFVLDWASGEFFTDTVGEPQRVTDEQGVIERVQKRIYTQRGQYAIYSDDYGSDVQRILGARLPSEVTYAELDRTLRECSLAEPGVIGAVVDAMAPATPSLGTGSMLVAMTITIDRGIKVQLDLAL
jgi:hypothetical protein